MAHELYKQTMSKIKRGLPFAPSRYFVLQNTRMLEREKKQISITIASLRSGPEAKLLQGHDQWSYVNEDPNNPNIGILRWRSMDAALFFKRKIVEVMVEPVDPVPEGEIRDPIEAWIRVDLLGSASAKSASAEVRKKAKEIESNTKLLSQRVEAQGRIIEIQEKQLEQLREQMFELRALAVGKKKSPGKYRELGRVDVLKEMLELSARLNNSEELSATTAEQKKWLKVTNNLIEKVARVFKMELIRPTIGSKFDQKKFEAIGVNERVEENLVASIKADGIMHAGKLMEPAKVLVGGKKA